MHDCSPYFIFLPLTIPFLTVFATSFSVSGNSHVFPRQVSISAFLLSYQTHRIESFHPPVGLETRRSPDNIAGIPHKAIPQFLFSAFPLMRKTFCLSEGACHPSLYGFSAAYQNTTLSSIFPICRQKTLFNIYPFYLFS